MKSVFDDGPQKYSRIIREPYADGTDRGSTFWIDCRMKFGQLVLWLPGEDMDNPKRYEFPEWGEFWELCRTCPDSAMILDWIVEHAETDEQKEVKALIEKHLM